MLHLSRIARTYFCRQRIPKDLHAFFPKLEIKKKDRKAYTQEELQKLVNILALVDREKKPEYFWIPLLLLFSGSRSNEICMLRCDDVELRGNIWMLCFWRRVEFNQRTKNKKEKQAPIHNTLVSIPRTKPGGFYWTNIYF